MVGGRLGGVDGGGGRGMVTRARLIWGAFCGPGGGPTGSLEVARTEGHPGAVKVRLGFGGEG